MILPGPGIEHDLVVLAPVALAAVIIMGARCCRLLKVQRPCEVSWPKRARLPVIPVHARSAPVHFWVAANSTVLTASRGALFSSVRRLAGLRFIHRQPVVRKCAQDGCCRWSNNDAWHTIGEQVWHVLVDEGGRQTIAPFLAKFASNAPIASFRARVPWVVLKSFRHPDDSPIIVPSKRIDLVHQHPC